MQDSTLLWAALACTLLGIAMIYFLSSTSELGLSEIGRIQQMDEDEAVRVEGRVSSIRVIGNLTLIKISSVEIVDIVVFDRVELEEGEDVEVIGAVEDYKGKKEILAETIVRK